MTPIYILAAIAVFFVLLVKLEIIKFPNAAPAKDESSSDSLKDLENLPYKSDRKLLTKAEYSFYKVLLMAISDDVIVFCKVRLADFIQVDKGKTPQLSVKINWFNRISSKHVDFLLCRKDDCTIIAVIELDDKSHKTQKTIERDDFVNAVYKSADITVIRQKCQANYSIESLKIQLAENIVV